MRSPVQCRKILLVSRAKTRTRRLLLVWWSCRAGVIVGWTRTKQGIGRRGLVTRQWIRGVVRAGGDRGARG